MIAGNASAALELIEQTNNLNAIFTPVGGGGLISGTALAAHYFSQIKVYGAEPLGADDAYRSFKTDKLIPMVNPKTIADGLRTSLGNKGFEIIKQHVADIFTVKEQDIIKAMKLVWERMKIIIEPSSAVPLAALINQKEKFKGQKIGIIISIVFSLPLLIFMLSLFGGLLLGWIIGPGDIVD